MPRGMGAAATRDHARGCRELHVFQRPGVEVGVLRLDPGCETDEHIDAVYELVHAWAEGGPVPEPGVLVCGCLAVVEVPF